MNPEHLVSLKQAAELIKQGKSKPARRLIIDILRNDPNNAQAWYMLSFAVPRVDKQIFALQQTLRLMPENQKAIDRLEKLGGSFPPSDQKLETPATFDFSEDAPKPRQSNLLEESSEVDLLSQRLFGEKPAVEKETSKQVEEIIPKPPVFYHEIAEQTRSDEPEQGTEEYRPESIDQKFLGIPRKIFLIGVGIVLIGVIAILGFSPQLIAFINNSLPVQQAGISTLESQLLPTETIPSIPTQTNIPPTPTTAPTSTPIKINLFSTSDLLPASEASLTELTSIQTGIQSYVSASLNTPITVYNITDTRLQTFIWDFAKFEGFEEQLKRNQKIFEILGVADAGDDFNSFYQNIWVDPNGTLYLPDKEFIAIVGVDFSEYQKYSYAQAYLQAIRNQQFSFERRGFYPPCLELSEECDVKFAVVKGEPAFTAWQWSLGTFDEQAIAKMEQTSRKLYFAPVFSPPPVMEAIRDFPYDQGYKFVEEVYNQTGYEGVQGLYSELPVTTEQILHPDKYISGEIGTAIDTTDLSTLLSDEWHPLFRDSLGEWKTYLILSAGINPVTNISQEEAEKATEGWNGDFAQIFTTDNGGNLITAHWKFDTLTDTEEFINTFTQYSENRFGGETVNIQNINCLSNGVQTSCLTSKDADVIWIASSNQQVVEFILDNYSFLVAE